ncbi:MAG: hypothetical protein WA906_07665, partial [Pacificimonas sp.]
IVITGRPLSETATALADCLARNCPTNEDIRVTLQHAENQFVAGDYRGARATLQSSVGRNGDEGETHPHLVSSLYRASSRIAEHIGRPQRARQDLIGVREAVRDGLPKRDVHVLMADMDVADGQMKRGEWRTALRSYKHVEERARDHGNLQVANFAFLRRVNLMFAAGDTKGQWRTYQRRARAALADFIETPPPGAQSFALAARLLQASLASTDGEQPARDAVIDDFIAEMGTSARPTLIHSDPIDLGETPETGTQNFAPVQGGQETWVDIGFLVTPEGTVDDPIVLRGTGENEAWVGPVITSILSRRYLPLSQEPVARDGAYRV